MECDSARQWVQGCEWARPEGTREITPVYRHYPPLSSTETPGAAVEGPPAPRTPSVRPSRLRLSASSSIAFAPSQFVRVVRDRSIMWRPRVVRDRSIMWRPSSVPRQLPPIACFWPPSSTSTFLFVRLLPSVFSLQHSALAPCPPSPASFLPTSTRAARSP